MDMNTIESVVPTTDPGQWRDGDAWLAGGTVLFSYGSPVGSEEPLKRLLDLGQAGWPAVTVSDAGIELAATCTVAELYALPVSDAVAGRNWPGLALFRPCCDSFVASFKVWNMSTVGGNVCTALPAGPMISLCAGLDARATILGRHGSSRTVPVAEFVTGDGKKLPGTRRARSAASSLPAIGLGGQGGVPPVITQQPRPIRGPAHRPARRGQHFVITVTAATKRPVQLRFPAGGSRRRDGWPTPSRISSLQRCTTTTSTGSRHGAAT